MPTNMEQRVRERTRGPRRLGAAERARSSRGWTCGATSWRRVAAAQRLALELLQPRAREGAARRLRRAARRTSSRDRRTAPARRDRPRGHGSRREGRGRRDRDRRRPISGSDCATSGCRTTEIMDVVLAATARCFLSKTLDALGVLPDAGLQSSCRTSSRCSSSGDRSLTARAPAGRRAARARRGAARTRPASAFSAWTARTTPSTSAFTSFMSFIASRMQSVWPAATTSPTSTNGGASGCGER